MTTPTFRFQGVVTNMGQKSIERPRDTMSVPTKPALKILILLCHFDNLSLSLNHL